MYRKCMWKSSDGTPIELFHQQWKTANNKASRTMYMNSTGYLTQQVFALYPFGIKNKYHKIMRPFDSVLSMVGARNSLAFSDIPRIYIQ